jgi:hypothetical protein
MAANDTRFSAIMASSFDGRHYESQIEGSGTSRDRSGEMLLRERVEMLVKT